VVNKEPKASEPLFPVVHSSMAWSPSEFAKGRDRTQANVFIDTDRFTPRRRQVRDHRLLPKGAGDIRPSPTKIAGKN
jgi:hypothetical protein